MGQIQILGSDGRKERFGNGSKHGSGLDQSCLDRGVGGFGSFPEGSTHTKSAGDQTQAELPWDAFLEGEGGDAPDAG
jgi:hypothetical protein